MLDETPRQPAADRVHRLANQHNTVTFLEDQGYDPERKKELLELLRDQRTSQNVDDLLDEPFRRRALSKVRKARTRYSDGSYNIFYSALESHTTREEIIFWYGRIAVGSGNKPRTFYYEHITCLFSGDMKDLRGKVDEWPLLISRDCESAYPFCNRIGAAAISEGLHALYVPSARMPGGTCVPVFRRESLSDARQEGLVALSYQPDIGQVQEVRLDS
jgi:RES domain